MQRPLWLKCVKDEGEGDIVGDILKLASDLSAYNDIADVSAFGNLAAIKG